MGQAELRREILETLKFYADFQNYCQTQRGGISSVLSPAAIQEDQGDRARAVLAKLAAARNSQPSEHEHDSKA